MLLMMIFLLTFFVTFFIGDDLDSEAEKRQYHSGELNKRNEIYLHMDLQQTGLQGIESWGPGLWKNTGSPIKIINIVTESVLNNLYSS